MWLGHRRCSIPLYVEMSIVSSLLHHCDVVCQSVDVVVDSAILLDEEANVDDSRLALVVQLVLIVMLVVVAQDTLCSLMSSSWRCHRDHMLPESELDVLDVRGSLQDGQSDLDVVILVVHSLVV